MSAGVGWPRTAAPQPAKRARLPPALPPVVALSSPGPFSSLDMGRSGHLQALQRLNSQHQVPPSLPNSPKLPQLTPAAPSPTRASHLLWGLPPPATSQLPAFPGTLHATPMDTTWDPVRPAGAAGAAGHGDPDAAAWPHRLHGDSRRTSVSARRRVRIPICDDDTTSDEEDEDEEGEEGEDVGEEEEEYDDGFEEGEEEEEEGNSGHEGSEEQHGGLGWYGPASAALRHMSQPDHSAAGWDEDGPAHLMADGTRLWELCRAATPALDDADCEQGGEGEDGMEFDRSGASDCGPAGMGWGATGFPSPQMVGPRKLLPGSRLSHAATAAAGYEDEDDMMQEEEADDEMDEGLRLNGRGTDTAAAELLLLLATGGQAAAPMAHPQHWVPVPAAPHQPCITTSTATPAAATGPALVPSSTPTHPFPGPDPSGPNPTAVPATDAGGRSDFLPPTAAASNRDTTTAGAAAVMATPAPSSKRAVPSASLAGTALPRARSRHKGPRKPLAVMNAPKSAPPKATRAVGVLPKVATLGNTAAKSATAGIAHASSAKGNTMAMLAQLQQLLARHASLIKPGSGTGPNSKQDAKGSSSGDLRVPPVAIPHLPIISTSIRPSIPTVSSAPSRLQQPGLPVQMQQQVSSEAPATPATSLPPIKPLSLALNAASKPAATTKPYGFTTTLSTSSPAGTQGAAHSAQPLPLPNQTANARPGPQQPRMTLAQQLKWQPPVQTTKQNTVLHGLADSLGSYERAKAAFADVLEGRVSAQPQPSQAVAKQGSTLAATGLQPTTGTLASKPSKRPQQHPSLPVSSASGAAVAQSSQAQVAHVMEVRARAEATATAAAAASVAASTASQPHKLSALAALQAALLRPTTSPSVLAAGMDSVPIAMHTSMAASAAPGARGVPVD